MPTVSPKAASESIQITSKPIPGFATGGGGQEEIRARVTHTDRTIFGTSGVFLTPGIGTKIRAAEMRLSTNRKLWSVAREKVSSFGIAAEISEHHRCVGHHLHQHPRQEDQQTSQKSSEARHRRECGILNRGNDLNETDGDSSDESYHQQRQAQPERGHQRFPEYLYGELLIHFSRSSSLENRRRDSSRRREQIGES